MKKTETTNKIVTSVITDVNTANVLLADPSNDESTILERFAAINEKILFTFDETISSLELARRIYLYILPYWDDDGFTGLIFNGIKPTDATRAITRIQFHVRDHELYYPGRGFTQEQARKVLESQVA